MPKQGKLKMPVDAVVAVTYRCNSRCIMCNIWQIKDFPEMAPEAYLRLPKSLKDVNISGGEPFLRKDLSEIVHYAKQACPKANITISTNGFLNDTIKKELPKILNKCPDVGISVSIDGIGDMHEKVRQIPNAWPKVLETIRYCRDVAKIKDLKLAFTLNDVNYKQLKLAYEWSKKLKVGFTMAVAHSSDIYFGKKQANLNFKHEYVHKQFKHIIDELTASFNPKDWARAYFIDGLYKISQGKARPLESYAGQDFFYLDPRGDVYPSVIDNVVMGNLSGYKKFKDLWYSSEAQKARDDIAGFEDNYWMVCTARTAMKRNPLKVSNWIFKKKLPWTK